AFAYWGSEVALSPDGSRLALTRAGHADVIDVASGATLYSVEGGEGGLAGVVVSPDGNTLAASGKDGQVWSWRTGFRPRARWEHRPSRESSSREGVWSARFDPQGRRILTASVDGNVEILRADSLAIERDLKVAHGAAVSAEFSPD